MTLGIQSLILAIDNRAMEIHDDINIPVVNRDNFDDIENWILGQKSFGRIKLNLEDILQWKSQFNSHRHI
jgi:hypothetical protein